MNGIQFRELVSGHKRGFSAAALRVLLRLLEIPYSGIMALRNFFFNTGLLPAHRIPLHVISVGNLTLGGTGKTPMVAWLARHFLDRGILPGLISRGYGAVDGKNDEFLELAFRLPDVPHRLNRDRVAAAEEFWSCHEQEPVDVLILDDAFQHRHLARDLDIVLLDALEPFGFEHVFPRGMLREPSVGLRRADVVLLSRADRISATERELIQRRVRQMAPNAVWGEIVHRPRCLVTLEKKEQDLETIRGKKVLAFCGIGNPAAFRQTLLDCGANVVASLSFPDHYRFTAADWTRLDEAAQKVNADLLLCTMKDLVKIQSSCQLPVAAVLIDIAFIAGEDAVLAELRSVNADIIEN